MNITSGILAIAIGFALIIFRKWLINSTFDARNWYYGKYLGEKSKKIGYWIVPIIGVVVIVNGALIILRS